MTFESTDYRAYLRDELATRISRNPSFSMRAFAKFLGIAPSGLSQILGGSRNLSPQSAVRVASKLGLDVESREYFCLMVQLQSSDDPDLKASVQERLTRLRRAQGSTPATDLSVQLFRVVSEWYHFPILMMFDLPKFEVTARTAARKLGISEFESQAAIDRMLQLEMLSTNSRGRLVRNQDHWRVSAKLPDEGLRRFHRQMLGRAIESLDLQTPSEKIVGSETFAFDPKTLPKANAIVERCFSELIELSKSSKTPKEIYHLGIQLFRLTQATQ